MLAPWQFGFSLEPCWALFTQGSDTGWAYSSRILASLITLCCPCCIIIPPPPGFNLGPPARRVPLESIHTNLLFFPSHIIIVLGVLRSESRLITNVNLGFSTLAATALWLIAITMSLVIGIANSLIGGFGDGLSLHVQQGGAFLAILWVAAVLSAVASTYWLVVWFVEFRLSAFSRRRRNEAQVGGYRQMVGELRKDLKVDGHFDAHKTSVGQQERKEDDRS